jgi:4'-phosphopantetheinyl transferase EntD
MIGALLPACVAWAERFDDVHPGDLFPAEEAVIARAVEKRRREFTTGRWCARRALSDLGFAPVPILPGERGAPGWPDGVVGAITHCAGYRAAVVARTDTVVTVGVDAEPNEPLPTGVLETVALAAERRRLAELAAAQPAVCWDRLLFSAKESVYKAWFPLARRWLDFAEADIDVWPNDERSGGFTARLLVDGPTVAPHGRLSALSGRWLADDGLVTTAVVLLPVGGGGSRRPADVESGDAWKIARPPGAIEPAHGDRAGSLDDVVSE